MENEGLGLRHVVTRTQGTLDGYAWLDPEGVTTFRNGS